MDAGLASTLTKIDVLVVCPIAKYAQILNPVTNARTNSNTIHYSRVAGICLTLALPTKSLSMVFVNAMIPVFYLDNNA